MQKTTCMMLTLVMLISACAHVSVAPTLSPTATLRGLPSPTATIRPTPSQTPTPRPVGIDRIGQLSSKETAEDIAWSPDGTTYTIVGSFGVKIFGTKNNQPIYALPVKAMGVMYSPNSRFISAAYFDEINLIDVRNGQILATFKGDEIWHDGFSSDSNRYIYTANCPAMNEENCKDVIHVWDVAANKELLKIEAEKTANLVRFRNVLFDPTGTLLLVNTGESVIYIWDIEAGVLKSKLVENSTRSFDLFFSHNGKYLASFDEEEATFHIRLWDWTKKERIPTITGTNPGRNRSETTIREEFFSDDDFQITVVFDNDFSMICNLATGKVAQGEKMPDRKESFLTQLRITGLYSLRADELAYSPDNLTLASGNWGRGPVFLWDMHTQKIRATLDTPANGLIYNHRGDRLIVVNSYVNSEISIWDTATNQKLHTLDTDNAGDAVVSPDDSTLAITDWKDRKTSIEFWDIEHGTLLRTLLKKSPANIFSLSYSADGKTIYAMVAKDLDQFYYDLSVQSWDTLTGKALPETIPHFNLYTEPPQFGDSFLGLANDTLAIYQYKTDEIDLLNVKTGQKVQVQKDEHFDGYAPKWFFVPHSQIALTDFDAVKVYDVKIGQQLYSFNNLDLSFDPIAFASDGSQMATGDGDGTILLWDLSRVIQAVSAARP